MEHRVKDGKRKKQSKKAKGWAWSGRKPIRSEKFCILKERRREWKNWRCYLKRRRFFFFHILIKNHVQTSRKKLKGKLLTKTNRGIKRSQSGEEGGEIRYLFSLRTSWARSWVRRAQGKSWPGKSTQRYCCRMPKSLIPFTSTGPLTSQYTDCYLSTCEGADHSDVKRWHRGSGPRSCKSQFCHQSAVRPWINCLTSAHVLIYKWRW